MRSTTRLVWTLLTLLSFTALHAQKSASAIIHVKGDQLLDKDNKPVLLQGVSFGNEVWSNNPLPYTHHTEADFRRVKDMGMNTIRFYMNYCTFEEDERPYQYKKSGWDWLDKNIRWARKHGIYLILNMHVPQGGFQSNGGGKSLWTDMKNRKRLKALWHNIAKRYAGESAIAGYDLLNEPYVTHSIDQWKTLAQQLSDTIRKADQQHVIIVERLNAINGDWGNDEDMNFFLINDKNVLYTFHFYEPIRYTHQFASWTNMGEGGKYPDENVTEHAGGKAMPRDKAYLACQLNRFLAFGTKHHVPLYLGEFGLIQHCFQNNKGGVNWVSDMLGLLKENNVHFTYHCYHEDHFGIYAGSGKEVGAGRNELIMLFRER
jgi:aryl-phospho-beta-D-glucosidase BglC (GH1 family)